MMKEEAIFLKSLLIGVFTYFVSSCDILDQEENVMALSTVEVTKITTITAMSGGNISDVPRVRVTERGVCWSTVDSPTIEDNKAIGEIRAGSFTSNLKGLKAGTTYHVRAYATNREGTVYGNTIIFETLDNTFTDSRDGNVYRMVTIGDQIWMAENLRFLPRVDNPDTGSLTTPHYYVYGYSGTDVNAAKSTGNYVNYGVLYNWPAAMAGAMSSTENPSAVQGICPTGWHLPSDAEWAQLTDYLGGGSVAGGELKETGTSHWRSPNTGASNESGFSALPGGFRLNHGAFISMGNKGFWWSASEVNTNSANYRSIYYNVSFVNSFHLPKELGFCVRCIRD